MKAIPVLFITLALCLPVCGQALAQTRMSSQKGPNWKSAQPRNRMDLSGTKQATLSGATPAQIADASEAAGYLIAADNQLDNLQRRAPFAAQELKGLLKPDPKAKGKPKSAQVQQALQSLQVTLRDLMSKTKAARDATKPVIAKRPLFASGKVRYADYKAILTTAEANHSALFAATRVYIQVYKKIPSTSSIASTAADVRSVANYCDTYGQNMTPFETAYRKL